MTTSKKRLTSDEKEEIVRLYQSGMPPKIIGERFGIFNNSVTRILRQMGIERNQRGKDLSQEEILKIINLYNGGTSSMKLATEFKVDQKTILRTLKRNNIATRQRSDYSYDTSRKSKNGK